MSSALGKRKERGENDAEITHGSTLFVSNLPYTATSVDLQTLFSDVAPVRSAFVVTEHGTGVSKGVGYVSFAIKEDAQSAFETISKEGLALQGRSLRVQWADKKPKDKDESVKKESKPRPPPRPSKPFVKAPKDPDAIRTIVISGLSASLDSKALWKKVRKYAGAEKIEWPAKNSDGSDDNSRALALFDTSAHAQDAVTKLHAHVFKGSLLSVTLKKRLDDMSKVKISDASASGPAAPSAEPSSNNGTSNTKAASARTIAPSRSSRLIIRNLPWNITEQDLRAIFLPHGPIHSIHIPEASSENGQARTEGEEENDSKAKSKKRSKGYAFVWMLSKSDAEKAIEKCNGMLVRPGVAEEMVKDKQKRKKERREEAKRKKEAAAATTSEMQEGGDGDEEVKDEDYEMKEDGAGRVIAVDWALSKQRWEEEKAKMAVDGEEDEDMESGSEESVKEEDREDQDEEEKGETDEEDESDSHIGVHDSVYNNEVEDDDRSDDDEERFKPQLPPPAAGTTLFIRNIPFEATEVELRTLFRSFGPLRYARITLDPESGRSRGTGFACFWNIEDADKAIHQSELLKVETTGSLAPTPKKNPFSLPTLLTPDPSSSLAQSLVLHGRTLDVVRAVTRDEAGRLKEEGERRREKSDKRNLYLLREGVILPNSPAASTISATDLEKRTSSFNARRQLLRTNPSLYVSRTRLSVRQIPVWVTERMMKRLALWAVKSFEKEVKEGKRTALSEDELREADEEKGEAEAEGIKQEDNVKEEEGSDEEDGGEHDGDNAKAKKRPHHFKGKGKSRVKQTKLILEPARVDPLTGKGRSRGYGFVEMHNHADALRVLRWTNNNPEVLALFERWWKDEMKDLIRMEKDKHKGKKQDAASEDSNATRLKRLEDELERAEKGEGKKATGKGSLIAEFSIENIQVVRRRAAQGKDGKPHDKHHPHKRAEHERTPAHEKEKEPTKKKQRLVDKKSSSDETKPAKSEQNKFGSLIGRKRKERKSKSTKARS